MDYFFSCNVSFLPDLSHSVRTTLQYLLVERCMELARSSSSFAISIDMLIPIVFVFLPIGFVAISYTSQFVKEDKGVEQNGVGV